MIKKHGNTLFFVLVALTVGFISACDEPPVALAATIEWDWPIPAGCYLQPADGFLVRVVVNGAEVATDTVATNSWPVPMAVGATQVRVASFWDDNGKLKVGMQMRPDCTVLPDTLWSVMSEPVIVEAQSGVVTKLRVVVGVE